MITITFFIIISLGLVALCTIGALFPSKKIFYDLNKHNKFSTLDGIRGFAALGVFLHHSIICYHYVLQHKWSVYPGEKNEVQGIIKNIFNNIGPASVFLFFMITGFLFYSKLINSKGAINTVDFFTKRFKRIAPLYFFVVFLAFILSFTFGLSGYKDFLDFIHKSAGWFTFGIMPYSGFTEVFSRGLITAGVFWTLAYEWKFYLLVPLLAVFCITNTRAKFFPLVSILLVFICYKAKIFSSREITITLCFLVGMFSASYLPLLERINSKFKSFLSLISLVSLLYVICQSGWLYRPYNMIGLVPFFVFAAAGNSMFGILHFKGLRLAGLISYSIYLVHGLILSMVNGHLQDMFGYRVNTFISAFLVILVSILTYLYIERPFIKPRISKKLIF